jgi:hypothetical protein
MEDSFKLKLNLFPEDKFIQKSRETKTESCNILRTERGQGTSEVGEKGSSVM